MIQTQTMGGTAPADGAINSGVPQWRPKLTVEHVESPEQRAAREAREAVEAQRKDQLDREEREAAAKRAHALEVMRATFDHNVAVRSTCSVTYDTLAMAMGGAAALGALISGLVAAVIR